MRSPAGDLAWPHVAISLPGLWHRVRGLRCRARSLSGLGTQVLPRTLSGEGARGPQPCQARRVPDPAQVLEKYTDGPQSGVFTDGSSVPNPGPGGWGLVWVADGKIREERHGHDPETTNNRMELKALIEAYRLLPENAAVVVHTDSKLCADTLNLWAANWERRGWKRKGPPIKNLELVKELWCLFQAHPDCRLEWIRAHSGYLWNEYADSLATAWLRDEL